jgi:Spy/CpxP family protein refolding chaperone
MKTIFSIFTAFIFIAFTQSALACDKKAHGLNSTHYNSHNSCPCKLRDHLEELDLSKEQTKAISAIKKETRQKMQELKKQKKAIPNIRKLNPTKDDYMEKVKDVAEKSGEIAQEFVTLIAEQRIEIYKVLNKEQQKQLLSLEKKPVKMHKKHQCKYDKKHKELSAPKQTLLEPAKKCKDTHQCDDSKACH